jgi:DNA end-binding protein Ku
MPPLRTGLLSFGLVSIPVQLHTATKDQRIAFHLLRTKCGSRVQNRYHCPVCNVTVEREGRVRGYEFAKDQYVQFTEAELESLETEDRSCVFRERLLPRRWRRRREALSAAC